MSTTPPETELPWADRIETRGRTLREHTARGTTINAAFLIGLTSLGLIKGFVVAGFLTPSDYGLWGIILVGLATLSWLKGTSVGDKYIQQSEADQELAFQRAMTIELLLTVAFIGVLVAAIPVLALVYGDSRIILPCLAIALVHTPATALQSPLWVFYRRMEFLRQRSLQAVDPIVGFVVTIGLAIAGAGYWSLVLGLVVGAIAGAAVTIHASPYKLGWHYDGGTLRQYFDFSWPLLIAGLSGLIIAQGSLVVSDQALGLAAVGAISLAVTIANYSNRVDTIVTQTLYPAICAVQDRPQLLFEAFVKSNRLALMWGLPFGVGVALFAEDLVEFALGAQWRPAIGLTQAFGIFVAVNQIGFNWHAFYRARGETKPVAWVNAVGAAAFLAAVIPLTITEGLGGYAIGMGVVTAVGLASRTFYLTRLFPRFRMWQYMIRAMLPTVPAAGAVLLVRLAEIGERTPAIALGELALYSAVTVLATLVFERSLLREIRDYVLTRGSRA